MDTKVTTKVKLTDLEEQVLRMVRGASVPPHEPLALRGQHIPETRAKLAIMENEAIEALRGPKPAAEAAEPATDPSAKAHIIARLREED